MKEYLLMVHYIEKRHWLCLYRGSDKEKAERLYESEMDVDKRTYRGSEVKEYYLTEILYKA